MKKIFVFCALFICLQGFGQRIFVELGPDQFYANQFWTITITVENDRLKSYTPFPEIRGLVKRGTSSSTSTSYINGVRTSTQSITQNYQVEKLGTILIPDFQININNQLLNVKGKKITALEAQQQNNYSRNPFDIFENFYNSQPKDPTEYVDVKEDAFLALTTDKNEVYIGEGFNTVLAFYVANTNQADMRFYDISTQLTKIVQEIMPANCWEENFNIENIEGENIILNNKSYVRYKLFQATYFPLNLEDVSFPKLSLKLIKYKRAIRPTFFGNNRQESFKTFYTNEKTIKVKDLPPHPSKDKVSVGIFRLKENIDKKELATGQSFSYDFVIEGIGNISAVEQPIQSTNKDFDFYPPNVRQNIVKASNTVRGSKKFEFYAIPNEPGTFELKNYIHWIYFNPSTHKYDTLKPNVSINVTGQSKKNEYITSNDVGSFYDTIDFENNQIISLEESMWSNILATLFILASLIGSTLFLTIGKINNKNQNKKSLGESNW